MHVDVKRLTLTMVLTKGELLPEDSTLTFDDLSFALSDEEIETLYDKYFNNLPTEGNSLKELFDASWYNALQAKGLLDYSVQEVPFKSFSFYVNNKMDCPGDSPDREVVLPSLFLKDASLKPIFKSDTWTYFRLGPSSSAEIYSEITSRLHIDNDMGMEFCEFPKDEDDYLGFNLPMKNPMLSPVQRMFEFTSLNAGKLNVNNLYQGEYEKQVLMGPCSMLGCRMPGLPNLYKVPLMIDLEATWVGRYSKCVPMLYVALAEPRTTTDLFQSGLVYKKGTDICPVEMLYAEACKANNIPVGDMLNDFVPKGARAGMPKLHFGKGDPCVYDENVMTGEKYGHDYVVQAEKRLREGYNIDVTSGLFVKIPLSMKAFRYLIPHMRKLYSGLDTLERQYLTDVLDYMQAVDTLYSEHRETLKSFVGALCNPDAYNLPLLPIYTGGNKNLDIGETLYCKCLKPLKEPKRGLDKGSIDFVF